MSKREIFEKLQDPLYRSELVSSEIDIGIPMQLRAMRDERGWKQSFVAEKTGTKQPRFSLMEKPGYGNFSLNTLKKLAALFDVGLIVSFVPWGEMIDFVESLSHRRLAIPAFNDERKRLASTYSRVRHSTGTSNSQLGLFFSGASSVAVPVPPTNSPYKSVGSSKPIVQIEPEFIQSAYIATLNLQGRENYVNAS